MEWTGGCLCGAVRYEASEPPQKSGYCHCRMCQKVSGAPCTVGVYFAKQVFRITRGQPTIYRSSNVAERGFCRSCGSQLLYLPIGSESISACSSVASKLARTRGRRSCRTARLGGRSPLTQRRSVRQCS